MSSKPKTRSDYIRLLPMKYPGIDKQFKLHECKKAELVTGYNTGKLPESKRYASVRPPNLSNNTKQHKQYIQRQQQDRLRKFQQQQQQQQDRLRKFQQQQQQQQAQQAQQQQQQQQQAQQAQQQQQQQQQAHGIPKRKDTPAMHELPIPEEYKYVYEQSKKRRDTRTPANTRMPFNRPEKTRHQTIELLKGKSREEISPEELKSITGLDIKEINKINREHQLGRIISKARRDIMDEMNKLRTLENLCYNVIDTCGALKEYATMFRRNAIISDHKEYAEACENIAHVCMYRLMSARNVHSDICIQRDVPIISMNYAHEETQEEVDSYLERVKEKAEEFRNNLASGGNGDGSNPTTSSHPNQSNQLNHTDQENQPKPTPEDYQTGRVPDEYCESDTSIDSTDEMEEDSDYSENGDNDTIDVKVTDISKEELQIYE
jgi:hypothetical protein